MFVIKQGDCLEVMRGMDAGSVDAVVCDPPYGLRFMGKEWDHGLPGVPFWTEALRVAKPGAHLLAFGGTRTFHRLACAIEDAGWEIRDCLSWMYGQGFPKSLDVSKAIDKEAGHWRGRAGAITIPSQPAKGTEYERTEKGDPVTAAAAAWSGWGTALKPAWEPVIMARKPLVGTVAENVKRFGTGGVNVDGCRLATGPPPSKPQPSFDSPTGAIYGFKTGEGRSGVMSQASGRWPANVCMDEEAARMLDEQSGESRSVSGGRSGSNANPISWAERNHDRPRNGHTDSGGVSRFFYCAKASRGEREAGLDSRNNHPTVKPIALMRWLCRLVTPPGGLVLDPFCGSGSTGCAAVLEGFNFVGIEKQEEYVTIANKRVDHWYRTAEPTLPLEVKR